MTTVTTKDGTEIYYRDWGAGQPVVLSHGWPLSSEAWAGQMLFLAQNSCRVVAHDRRGHGRSSQTVRVPPVFIQPMAAEDVAKAVASVAVGGPVNGIVEVAGPERLRFDEFIRRGLRARNDPREVVVDSNARYYGARLNELTLVPAGEAKLGEIRFEDWLRPSMSSAMSSR